MRPRKYQCRPVIEAANKRPIEVRADWYPQDYSYDAQGALVSDYGFDREANSGGGGN